MKACVFVCNKVHDSTGSQRISQMWLDPAEEQVPNVGNGQGMKTRSSRALSRHLKQRPRLAFSPQNEGGQLSVV